MKAPTRCPLKRTGRARLNDNGERVEIYVTFVFEFSETDTETLRRLLFDCVGVDSYASLTAQFFSQLSEQERRQRKAAMAQLPPYREECSQ